MSLVRTVLDEFPQFAVLQVSPAAAASGTELEQLVTGLTNQQKLAWELYRVELSLPASLQEVMLAADQNELIAGITQSNSTTQDLSLRGQSVVDNFQFNVQEDAAPTVRTVLQGPLIHELALPRLILPQMIFAFVTWNFTGAATTDPIFIRAWYKEREITKEDWYDLLQLRLPLGSQ